MNNFSVLRTEEWYERCREWLISAGGRRLWEKDMVWGTNLTDRKVDLAKIIKFQDAIEIMAKFFSINLVLINMKRFFSFFG